MNHFAKTLVAASVAAAAFGSQAALAEVSANIGVTSNYIWRGVSQTGDESAVSGGIDYANESGFYAGTWTSSLGGTSSETDFYAGFGGAVGEFGYDVSVVDYTYPQLKDADFAELILSGSYSYFTVGIAQTISSQVDDADGTAESFIEGDQYYWVSAEMPVKEDLSVGLSYGSYKFDDDGVANTDLDYSHYQLALTKSAGDAGDFTFAYDKNDIDDTTPNDGIESDTGRFSVAWSKSFDL